MASIMSHAVAASSLGAVGSPRSRMPHRYWIALAIVAALPDADVVAFALAVPYGNMLGHRGITHSLAFAAVVAALVVRLVFRDREWHHAWPRLWLVYFVGIASHGLLDAMTTGGQGIAFLAPFSAARWHFGWRPILVSPIGVGAFISMYGLRVLQNELVWVWLPSALVALAAWIVRRRAGGPGEAAA
jgi:inner membrane protein